MPQCPTCRTPLTTVRQREGYIYQCPTCEGRAVAFPQIRRVAGDAFVTSLLRAINQNETVGSRACPFCARRMRVFQSAQPPLELDACKPCGVIWFDPQEFEAAPTAVTPLPDQLDQRAREALALYECEQIAARAQTQDDSPDLSWQNVPALFGFPVESDTPALERRPWATWSLALVIASLSVWAFFYREVAAQTFGFIPTEAGRYGGLTFLTSFFLHGSVMHLVGNIYFLLIFGDNVEDYLGRWRYLGLILAATFAGDALHLLLQAHSAVPCIGASGGISGVIVFYALQFPHARLGFLFGAYFRYQWVQLPAWGALVLWLLLQFFTVAMQLNGFSHVAATAHLGGAAVGFLCWRAWRKL